MCSLGLCSDYRLLVWVTVEIWYPLPRIVGLFGLTERAIVIAQWITDQDIRGSSDRLFQLFEQFRDLFVDDILVYSRSEAELVKHFRFELQTLRVGLSGSSELKPYRIWWLS